MFVIYNGYILLIYREHNDHNLSFKLRAEDKITTPGLLFAKNDKTEFDKLIDTGILRPIFYNETKYTGARIFKSRIVRKIKDRYIDKPCEKSHLIVQSYNDNNKYNILIQSSTIQRTSQRLLLVLISNCRVSKITFVSKDISQTYT